MVGGAGRHETWMGRGLWAAPVLLCAGLALAACGDINRFQTPIQTPTAPNPVQKPSP